MTWDSNRPQPLPSITLKYFIHVSYELLQLAAIMTFVHSSRQQPCVCVLRILADVNYAAEETDLCLYSRYHPSCADTGHCPHTTHTITSLFRQQQTRFLVSVSPFLSLIGIIELSSNLLYFLWLDNDKFSH